MENLDLLDNINDINQMLNNAFITLFIGCITTIAVLFQHANEVITTFTPLEVLQGLLNELIEEVCDDIDKYSEKVNRICDVIDILITSNYVSYGQSVEMYINLVSLDDNMNWSLGILKQIKILIENSSNDILTVEETNHLHNTINTLQNICNSAAIAKENLLDLIRDNNPAFVFSVQ